MHIKILYQDQDIILINKPFGVVVNLANTNKNPSIQEWFALEFLTQEPINYLKTQNKSIWQALVPPEFDASYGSPEEIFINRQGIVHRLDKDTSGVLLLAKNPGALVNLLWQFKQRTTQKSYQCLVHGKPSINEGVIDAPLARSSKDRQKFAVVAGGRTALTHYQVAQNFLASNLTSYLLSKYPDSKLGLRKQARIYEAGFSLINCWPKTGRTHQIRVHLKHLGHPLVGDSTYVGKKRAKIDALWCQRHFLHATSLEFAHPRSGQKMTISAPLTADLQAVLSLL